MIDAAGVVAFAERVRDHASDLVFLTGDISQAPVLVQHLKTLDEVVQKPIFFVLGNHDYWYSSYDRMRANLNDSLKGTNFLTWLSAKGAVRIDATSCVVGHDGWYDCRAGEVYNSLVVMPDWSKDHDFAGSRVIGDIITRSQNLAHIAVEHVKKSIIDALQRFDRLFILTHFPPFVEAHVHEGKAGDVHWSPYFVNVEMGEMLRSAAAANPNKQFIVLAGHTHGEITVQVSHNLTVHVAAAEHGNPTIQSRTFT